MKQKTLKILSTSIMISIILCCFTNNTISQKISNSGIDVKDDELDQSQEFCNQSGILGNESGELKLQIAQSFKPEKEILTRVQILLGRSEVLYSPCVVSIKEELDSEILATALVYPSEIPFADDPVNLSNLSWITFNFNDLTVNTTKSYYIVISTGAVENYYVYGYSDENVYSNGSLYTSSDLLVWENTTYDLCFRTYGADAAQPDVVVTNIIGSFLGGIKGIIVKVNNTGGANATDVQVNVSITGGIFGLVNLEYNETFSSINASEEKQINVSGAFGLGFVTVNVTVQDDAVSRTCFIIGRRILVPPTLF